jgi:hypothetical protein
LTLLHREAKRRRNRYLPHKTQALYELVLPSPVVTDCDIGSRRARRLRPSQANEPACARGFEVCMALATARKLRRWQSGCQVKADLPNRDKHGSTLVQHVPVFTSDIKGAAVVRQVQRGSQHEAAFYGTRATLCCTDRRSRAHSAHSRPGTPWRFQQRANH